MIKKLLLAYLFILSTLFSFSQVTFNGNGNTGFGGPVGDGITSGISGADPVTFTSKLEYPSGKVLNTNTNLQNNIKINYSNSHLYVNGVQDKFSIKVFDVLGNLVINKMISPISQQFSIKLDLPKNQIHILAVEGKDFKKVLKIIS